MDAPLRSVIAYIAGRLLAGTDGWWMRDIDRHLPVQFEGSFEPTTVKVYSHELHDHIAGSGGEGKWALFLHRVAGSIDLAVNSEEHTFRGCDQRNCFHFFGNVEERTVRLFDYQDLRWHEYTLT